MIFVIIKKNKNKKDKKLNEWKHNIINFKEKEVLINPSIMIKPNPGLMINYGPKNPKSITLLNMVKKNSHI